MKMFSKASKWLIVVHLLLSEHALCMGQPLAQSGPLPRLAAHEARGGAGVQGSSAEDRSQSAERIVEVLRAKLQGQIQGHIHLRGNVSCGELLSASTLDDPLSSAFPRELLGVSLVPALVVAGCPREAQSLVLKLYQLLGTDDTEELLMDVQELMQRRMKATPSAPSESDGAGRHIEAVMFNIQQLAGLGEGKPGLKRRQHCEGWTRVNATTLVGAVVEGATGELEEAVSTCEKLGVLCAGVTGTGTPGKYYAVVKRGSRILPSESPEAESWIHQCSVEARRPRRSTPDSCINKSEERVYNVMEWIPAVSTLYNLGTAVYYASVNCSETAKERAILSAVDLGTDALMVATGGTAGVAGYALGAGVKTGVKAGVKYLLNSMKDDDMLVNQSSWEDGVITIQ